MREKPVRQTVNRSPQTTFLIGVVKLGTIRGMKIKDSLLPLPRVDMVGAWVVVSDPEES